MSEAYEERERRIAEIEADLNGNLALWSAKDEENMRWLIRQLRAARTPAFTDADIGTLRASFRRAAGTNDAVAISDLADRMRAALGPIVRVEASDSTDSDVARVADECLLPMTGESFQAAVRLSSEWRKTEDLAAIWREWGKTHSPETDAEGAALRFARHIKALNEARDAWEAEYHWKINLLITQRAEREPRQSPT